MRYHDYRMMQGIPSFLREVAASCYDMEYYRTVRAERPVRAFAYAARFFAALGCIGVLLSVPAALSARTALVAYLDSAVPDGANLALTAKGLMSNVQMPQRFGTSDVSIVLDTTVDGGVVPQSEKGSVVFGAHAAFFPESDGSTQAVPYADLPQFSVTKDSVVSALRSIAWHVIALAAAGLALGWAAVSFISACSYVLGAAGAAYLAARMAKLPMRYSQWIAVGMHAITLPTLLMLAFGASLGRVPFAHTLIFAMILFAVASDERANPVAPLAVEPLGPPRPPAAS